jgi:hypothetical protein
MQKLIIFVSAAFILAPCLAYAATNTVQAENFTQSYNILPDDIVANGGVLVGLDAAGEWAQFQLFTAEFGTFSVTMRCWGTLNVPYRFNLVTVPAEGEIQQTIQLNYTGKGSCGA